MKESANLAQASLNPGFHVSIRDAYNAALRSYCSGDMVQAEKTLRKTLTTDNKHADSLHLLGLIGLQTGHLNAAAELLMKAIEVNGQQPMYRGNLGLVLQALGRTEDAAAQYERALSLQPDYPEAHLNLGNILQSQGKVEAAIARFNRAVALKPQYPEGYMNLGNALQSLGRFDEAITQYQRALLLRPDYAEAHMNLGNALAAVNRHEDAVTQYKKAISLQPGYAEAYLNLGNLLQERGELKQALVNYDRALAIRPNYAEAHMNRGIAFEALREPEQAIEQYKRALAIRPDYAEAHANLGNALQSLGRWEEAIVRYEQGLAFRPAYAEAHMNLGMALDELGRIDAAARQYEQALAIRPDYAELHMNRSLNQLKRGEFSVGWIGHEWRWRLQGGSSEKPRFSQPQWYGEPLAGQRILLHGEQGLGDCLQFLRYLPMVQASGGRVILEIPRGLLRLCSTFSGLDDLVATGEPLPAFDRHCPLMSLPLAFGTVVETIPAQVPYLSIPQKARQMAAEFPWPAKGFRVGLVWAGNPKHRKDHHRSIHFNVLAPLMGVAHVQLFSLQFGEAAKAALSGGQLMTDLAQASADMADTAALIDQLDLLIAVDTAVAHLAGALAKPVWILLAHQADWRWLKEREDTPWYPTARLFRQAVMGDWVEVIDRVKAALSLISHTHAVGC